MIYNTVIMCQVTKEDKPTYYRFKAKGDNPDEAFSRINKLIGNIQRDSYMQMLNNSGMDRDVVYRTMKQIKNAFYVIEMHQSDGNFEEGPCEIVGCRIVK